MIPASFSYEGDATHTHRTQPGRTHLSLLYPRLHVAGTRQMLNFSPQVSAVASRYTTSHGKSCIRPRWEDTVCGSHEIKLAAANVEAGITRWSIITPWISYGLDIVIVPQRARSCSNTDSTSSAAWPGESLFIDNGRQSFLLLMLLFFADKDERQHHSHSTDPVQWTRPLVV